MTDPIRMEGVFRFDDPGALRRPGPIGRLARAGFGAASLYLVWQIAFVADASDYLNPSIWPWAALGLYLAPYVVNIGFGVSWGGWPRIVALAVVGAGAAAALAFDGGLLTPIAWVPLAAFLLYVYGHLGVSFVLSALIATPGCEMRAIPDLLGRVRSRAAAEHYCPGFIGTIDRWETQLAGKGRADEG